MDVDWDNDGKRTLDSERQQVIKDAAAITASDPIKKPNVDEFFGPTNRPPLVGCTDHMSQLFRGIIADRFSGLTIKESCKRFDLRPRTFYEYKSKHKEGWDQAIREMHDYVTANIDANSWIVMSALSDLGPHFVRTLWEISADKRAPHGVRKDAAVQGLKLLGVDKMRGPAPALEKATAAMRDLAGSTMEKFEDERIVEAIDAEYVDVDSVGDSDDDN